MDFLNSQNWLAVAQKKIPLGAQTFSKSITQFPPEISPLFCSHGKDGRIWDIDGNCFVDLISGLASVTLGYANNDVNEAVIEQLSNGVTFSLSTKLELEVAELISLLVLLLKWCALPKMEVMSLLQQFDCLEHSLERRSFSLLDITGGMIGISAPRV